MKRKKHGRWKWVLLAATAAAVVCCISVYANLRSGDGPSFQLQTSSAWCRSGDKVQVQLSASPGRTAPGAFRALLQYDSDAFEYCSKEGAPQTYGADIYVWQSNPLVTVYTCNTQQSAAPQLAGNVITYTFRVRQGTSAGRYSFRLSTDEICDFAGKSLPPCAQTETSVSVTSAESSASSAVSSNISSASSSLPSSASVIQQPHLSALELEDHTLGQLRPTFQPDITFYPVTVPQSCTDLWLRTQQSAGTAVSADRHSLKAAGSDTVIQVTAQTAGSHTKTVYTILVHRSHDASSAGTVGAQTKKRKTERAPSAVSSKKEKRTSSASKQTTHKKKTSASSSKVSKKTKRSSSSAASDTEAYAPSGISQKPGAQQTGGLQARHSDGFSGFQTGVLVTLLIACAATAVVLVVRAVCRKRKAEGKAEQEANDTNKTGPDEQGK